MDEIAKERRPRVSELPTIDAHDVVVLGKCKDRLGEFAQEGLEEHGAEIHIAKGRQIHVLALVTRSAQ